MLSLALIIQYDGTNYCGWQTQKNEDSVQQRINISLEKIAGEKLTVVGAGRTDAGVHANYQVGSVRLESQFPVPESKIVKAINSNLPADIRITSAKILDFGFNARKDSVAREYSYYIHTKEDVFKRQHSLFVKYNFDFNILNEAAEIFTGIHDFTTFSKLNKSTKNYICNVQICQWHKSGEHTIQLRIKADRFVYGMVRALTGAMLDAARGKITLENLKDNLIKRDRNLASPLVPACGLFLERVYYSLVLL